MDTQTSESASIVHSGETADVVRSVVELIQERGLKVGDKLPPIRQLAASLEVKPTVVRDALLQAQTMGLVQILPRSGAYVQSLTYAPLVEALANTLSPALMQEDHNLFHLLDARRTLEIELAGRAAQNPRMEDLLPVRNALEAMTNLSEAEDRPAYAEHDVRFHVGIARMAGNSVLFTVHGALLDLLRPYLAQIPRNPERRSRTDRSHAAIYAALAAGDADKARDETRLHLSMAYDSLLHDVAQPPISAVRSAANEEGQP